MPVQCSSCGGGPIIARGLCHPCYRRAHRAGTLPPKVRTKNPPTPRQQFVRVCACGCGEPTLLAPYTYGAWGWVKGVPLQFVHNHHAKGERNYRWKGGRYEDRDGYVWVVVPGHPCAKRGNAVQEHRLVMEAHLGRYLTPKELVHHRNEVKNDNRLENLELTNRPAHMRMHKPGPGRRKPA